MPVASLLPEALREERCSARWQGASCGIALLSSGRVILSIIMANEGGGNNNDVVFVYTGGDQEVPFDATHAIVDPSVKMIIRQEAFYFRCFLASIEINDGVKFIYRGFI